LSFLIAILAGVAAALLFEALKATRDHIKLHGFTWGRPSVIISGQWYARWQTTTAGKELFNNENLNIKQRGRRLMIENESISPDNPRGGYMWRGELTLYGDQHFIGWYTAKNRSIISKGALYFVLTHDGPCLLGKWVGCNIDYSMTWGFAVIAKHSNDLEPAMQELIKRRRIKL
jgi:hypothetical protein